MAAVCANLTSKSSFSPSRRPTASLEMDPVGHPREVDIEIKDEPLTWDDPDLKPNIESCPRSMELLYKKHYPSSGIEVTRLLPMADADYRTYDFLPPIQQFNFPAPLEEDSVKQEASEETETDPLCHEKQDGGDELAPLSTELTTVEETQNKKTEATIPRALVRKVVAKSNEDKTPKRCNSTNTAMKKPDTNNSTQSTDCDASLVPTEGATVEDDTEDPEYELAASKRRVTCEYCKRTMLRCFIPTHLKRSHSGVQPYTCDKCRQRFDTEAEQTLHAALHSGPRPYFCTLCDARFKRRGDLTAHVLAHSGKLRYPCPRCESGFTTRQRLRHHVKTHEGQERSFRCSLGCGAAFAQSWHARQHEITKHGKGGRSYTCELCGASFARTNHLADHRRTHTGERPFPCTQCDKRFSRRPHLVRHMASHTGHRPYECATCQAAFSRRDDLERHVRTHTSDRRYACTECPARFLAGHHLKTHIRKVHAVPAQ